MNDELTLDEIGASACYAHLICPSCQRVLDGSTHGNDCHFFTERRANVADPG